MNAEEQDHGTSPDHLIQCHRPSCAAYPVSGLWEIGEGPAGGRQGAARDPVSRETSGPRGVQEARQKRREGVSEVGINPPEPVTAVQKEGIGTDGRMQGHRQSVMTRVRVLRAEQRSMRDIAAILNGEGMATFTGRGRWHHGMLPRILKAIEESDQSEGS
jgi:hypothetical protein